MLAFFILLLTPIAQGQEYELVWSHEICHDWTCYDVYDVSVSADASYIVAGSYNKVHFFGNIRLLAQSAIQEAKSVISQEKSKGYDTGKAKSLLVSAIRTIMKYLGYHTEDAESLLSQAQAAFNSRDYSKARILAEGEISCYRH
ncbi:hypothetical protein Shell_0496 [Staphylothermus hellenicus DSM 12710]|uniref:Uncharacterized protein n=1 Tax=Staphylothermus hellenicus (strain DSM 12710 / JCM 10830 / BK20S6-10-b1 / P8) TaxID=591019 RepID=D7DBT0_STAHD|nr:hypothetical protein Shell_0496 [Staphylothermus hellenicus DSM 12710]